MPYASRLVPYSTDVETIPADEAEDIHRVLKAIEVILAKSLAKSGEFRADVHVKTHGFARGEFRVLPNLPRELSQGLFAQDATYPAVVRFSNASNQAMPDILPDGRGMAFKVSGVEGDWVSPEEIGARTQDFLMINHPTFFARNVKDYVRLENVLLEKGDSILLAAQEALTGGSWNPLDWHWREVASVARIAGQLPTHPASNTYFSMAPIRYGDYVAKYRAKPVGERLDSYVDMVKKLVQNKDAMRLALEETLRIQEILFEFQVQLCIDKEIMPIEDASVEWPESVSPFRTVAHLLLPRQEITLLQENAAFNVWHALASHRPLGGINRVRRSAYAMSAAWRWKQSRT